MNKQDEAFIAAVKAMEKRTSRVSAYAIVNPNDPHDWGKVTISYPADGAGRLYAIAWLPGGSEAEGKQNARHHGYASGGGYDKASAAMGGATFWNLKEGKIDTLKDRGWHWNRQLEDAGYIVIQTV